jgi:hypothetical protein
VPANYLALLAVLIHGLKVRIGLSLSSTAVAPGAMASREVLLNSSSEAPPAPPQSRLQYRFASVSSLIVDGGPATVVGKTVNCTGGPTAFSAWSWEPR